MTGLIVHVALIIVLGSAVILMALYLREQDYRIKRMENNSERSLGLKFKVDNMESRVKMLERDNTRVQRALQRHDMEVDDGK